MANIVDIINQRYLKIYVTVTGTFVKGDNCEEKFCNQ